MFRFVNIKNQQQSKLFTSVDAFLLQLLLLFLVLLLQVIESSSLFGSITRSAGQDDADVENKSKLN